MIKNEPHDSIEIRQSSSCIQLTIILVPSYIRQHQPSLNSSCNTLSTPLRCNAVVNPISFRSSSLMPSIMTWPEMKFSRKMVTALSLAPWALMNSATCFGLILRSASREVEAAIQFAWLLVIYDATTYTISWYLSKYKMLMKWMNASYS